MARNEIHETTTDGPIMLPPYDPETGQAGPLVRVANSNYGVQLDRLPSGRERLMLITFDGDNFPEILAYEADAGAAGREDFDDILSHYVVRDHSYAGALAHPLSRGISVDEPGGPRVVAQVDMRIVSQYLRDIDKWRTAARHIDLLRQAYTATDWFQTKTTCWVRLAAGYDFRHVEALTGVRGLEIAEGETAYLQLSYREYKRDRLQIWEPQVLVTLDREPVYDLETDAIPGLTVLLMPDGKLIGERDPVDAERILLHDLLGDMPNSHEPHRWGFAIGKAMKSAPDGEEVEDADPAP